MEWWSFTPHAAGKANLPLAIGIRRARRSIERF